MNISILSVNYATFIQEILFICIYLHDIKTLYSNILLIILFYFNYITMFITPAQYQLIILDKLSHISQK